MLKEHAEAALKHTLVPRMNKLLLDQSYRIRKLNQLNEEQRRAQVEIQEVDRRMKYLSSQIKE